MRRHIVVRVVSVALLSTVFAVKATEQRVYQWTDSKGVVHYSQFEPERIPSQARDLHSLTDAAPPPPKTPEQTACDVATANQAMLAAGKEVPLTKGADGKMIPMSEDQIKAAKELAEKQVQGFCKSKDADKDQDHDHD